MNQTMKVDITDGRNVAETLLGIYLNGFPDYQIFYNTMAQHPPATQLNFLVLFLSWLKELSMVASYDDRNKASYELALAVVQSEGIFGKELSELIKARKPPNTANILMANNRDSMEVATMLCTYLAYAHDYKEFCLCAAYKEHKTLQQSFTRFGIGYCKYLMQDNTQSRKNPAMRTALKFAEIIIENERPLPYI